MSCVILYFFFFFQAEDGIRDYKVTGVQTCALPICISNSSQPPPPPYRASKTGAAKNKGQRARAYAGRAAPQRGCSPPPGEARGGRRAAPQGEFCLCTSCQRSMSVTR